LGNSFTLGIGTCVFGSGYGEFIDRWWEGVADLKTQPDSIVIAYDKDNSELVLNAIPDKYKEITKTLEMSGQFSDFMLAIQTNQTADWFSICGVDDKYLAGAFDELEEADRLGCDIYIDKLQLKHDQSIMEGRWLPELIPFQMTCPGAAPIKRTLFEKTGGHTAGAIFDDWELYIRCVKAGAKPYHSNTVRIIYDIGHERQTTSGVNRATQNEVIGKDHIARVRQELGW
jgi:hypothetical protein